jgi:hypothetical protein
LIRIFALARHGDLQPLCEALSPSNPPKRFMTDHPEERRAISRIHAVWKRLATHGLPSRSALDPKEFGDDWSSCLIVPVTGDNGAPRRVSETALDRNIPRQRLASMLLSLSQRHVSRVLATGEPLGYGGTASHEGIDILYRIALLPLSEDGAHIDALLVGFTHREVPPPSELRVSDIAWCKSPVDFPQPGKLRAQPASLQKDGTGTDDA